MHAKGQVWAEFIIFRETFHFSRSCSPQDKNGPGRARGHQPEPCGLVISACSYLQENYSERSDATVLGCWGGVFMYAPWS